MHKLQPFFCLMAALTLYACFSPIQEEGLEANTGGNGSGSATGDYTVSIRIHGSQTRAVPIGEAAGRLDLAVYNLEGTKVREVNQTLENDPEHFGEVTLSLDGGTYIVVAIGHNCEGKATMTKFPRITFPNNRVSDTFYLCDTVSIDHDATIDAGLRRCVAMVRFTIEDEAPAEAARMKFYYTGGSSTFDPTTGYGCVNSKQTEYRDIIQSAKPANYEIYTFPRSDSQSLKLTVTALDDENNTIAERVYDPVPISNNTITTHSESFFSASNGVRNGSIISFSVSNEWNNESLSF